LAIQEEYAVKLNRAGSVVVRLAILVAGFAVAYGVLYAAGKLLVPLTDGADKAILAFINPDTYAPGLDELFRAINDYTNPLILLPFICWMIFYALHTLSPKKKLIYYLVFSAVLLTLSGLVYRSYGKTALPQLIPIFVVLAAAPLLGMLPRRKPVLCSAFAVVSVVLLGVMYKNWENKTYIGANVLMVLMSVAAFGTFIWMFRTMDDDTMRRFSRVFWLVLLAGVLTDFGITQPIKETIRRPRPFNDANKPWNEHVRPIPDEILRGTNSFPSGHTSGAFALLTPLFWFARDRRVRAGLILWGTLQGVGRVYTAAHFPFCVFMGGLLGFSMGTLIFFTLWGPSLWRDREKVQVI
jgi:membrane-associated phospholipid phosphatase